MSRQKNILPWLYFLCIRTSTERPEAVDKACFVLSGIDTKGLLQAVELAVQLDRAGDFPLY